jgi:hypothetical protein
MAALKQATEKNRGAKLFPVAIVKKMNMRERGSFAPFNGCCEKNNEKKRGSKALLGGCYEEDRHKRWGKQSSSLVVARKKTAKKRGE